MILEQGLLDFWVEGKKKKKIYIYIYIHTYMLIRIEGNSY